MKFQYISDLHLEFKENREFFKEFPIIPSADYLLIAGDLGYTDRFRKNHFYFEQADKMIDYFSSNWKKTIIIPGNHEYYAKSSYTVKSTSNIEKDLADNVKFLNNCFDIIEGENYNYKIFGATLWSNILPNEYLEVINTMNDYNYIHYDNDNIITPGQTIEEHFKTVARIEKGLGTPESRRQEYEIHMKWYDPKIAKIKPKPTKLIILTHHLPSMNCIKECYRCSTVNSAYATNLESVIDKVQPDAWIFGHSHNVETWDMGKTKLLENSFGYAFDKSTAELKESLDKIFEV